MVSIRDFGHSLTKITVSGLRNCPAGWSENDQSHLSHWLRRKEKMLTKKDWASGICSYVMIRMQLCPHMCGRQTLTSGVFLCCSSPSVLRQDGWLNPELSDSAHLATHLALGITAHLPVCWDYRQTAVPTQQFMCMVENQTLLLTLVGQAL